MRSLSTSVLIALATVAARLPFLLRADRFFDADEAVEGLMARHVWRGEFRAFLWGQRYKGVPEIYLSSVAFRVAGPSVVVLKAVTLVCFVLFLCINFRVVERLFTRTVAMIATAFFIVGPPSLVLWSLSGSAEIVMTLLAGALLLLAIDAWRRSHASRTLFLGGVALGFGLWIQQYILFYVVALVVTAAITTPGWLRLAANALRNAAPRWLKVVLMLLAAGTALYVVLGFIAFFTPGFDVLLAGRRIVVTHPQKMWWIAGTLSGAAALLSATAVFRRALSWPALGFAVGYLPAALDRFSNSGMGAPISRMTFGNLRAIAPDMTTVMLPMLFGFRDPSARLTVLPILAALIATLLVLSFWFVHRLKLTPFFHVLIIVTPAMFLVSGSYIDPQTYRYLMPMYAALPVVYAIGVDGVRRYTAAGAVVLFVSALSIFTAQQIVWYRRLEPDRETAATIACLDRAGIRVATAGYWRSHTITFLTGERIIVVPTDGVDRYPPYTALASGPRSDVDSCGSWSADGR